MFVLVFPVGENVFLGVLFAPAVAGFEDDEGEERGGRRVFLLEAVLGGFDAGVEGFEFGGLGGDCLFSVREG